MTNKVQKIKQEIERLKEYTAKCGYPGQGEFENGNREGRNWVCDKLLSFIDSLPEESSSEDLEEEIQRFVKSSSKMVIGVGETARHFAEWQKQKDFKELLRSDMSQFKKCYEKGRADMRDEMAKNAVESEVYYTHMFDENGKPFTDVKFIRRNDNANYGSKAKIIIIKENNK